MEMGREKALTVGVLAIVGFVAVGIFASKYFDSKDKSTQQSAIVQIKGTVMGESIEKTPLGEGQKRVSARTEYESPAGAEEIEFSVIVDADDVIVDAPVSVLASDDTSKKHQAAFAQALPVAIKGHKLKELEPLETVGNSALTTEAFNNSLEDLKSQD
jgi:hypothetical protein